MSRTGVIFDLDGTLADTLMDITDSVNHAVQLCLASEFSAEQVRPLISSGARVMLERLTGLEDPGLLSAMLARLRSYYAEHLLDRTALYPGWPSALDQICRLGTRLAVLSNKPDDATQAISRVLLDQWTFDAVRGHVEGRPLKPDPGGAAEIRQAMRLSKGVVLMVGDSPSDMLAAKRGSMVAVGVGWGYHPVDQRLAAGADHVLNNPDDLVELAASC